MGHMRLKPQCEKWYLQKRERRDDVSPGSCRGSHSETVNLGILEIESLLQGWTDRVNEEDRSEKELL